MCEYAEIEKIKLSNGKTIKEVNEEVRKEVERIYLEGWAKGISIPFWDKEGNYYLANPDGSEDLVSYDINTRSYQIISRTADKGKPYYIHCKSFDGDLLALNLRKEHPEWEERWIGGTVAGELQKQIHLLHFQCNK